jgi:hypothetical protein
MSTTISSSDTFGTSAQKPEAQLSAPSSERGPLLLAMFDEMLTNNPQALGLSMRFAREGRSWHRNDPANPIFGGMLKVRDESCQHWIGDRPKSPWENPAFIVNSECGEFDSETFATTTICGSLMDCSVKLELYEYTSYVHHCAEPMTGRHMSAEFSISGETPIELNLHSHPELEVLFARALKVAAAEKDGK